MGEPSFLDAARNDHTEQPEGVAARLEDGLAHITSPDDVAPYAMFAVHLFGEHLGQWERGAQLLARISALPQATGSDAATGALRRGIAALRYAGGNKSATDGLDAADRAQVMCVICTMHVARHETDAATAALRRALDDASAGLPDKHAAIRSLAVAGNNLSAELEEKADLTPSESEAMVLAAGTGARYWKLAGTWLQHERAQYQLARCLMRAGRPGDAKNHILSCIEICEANDAPPFERFFGRAVLALIERIQGNKDAFAAQRDVALAHFADVPADDQQWCKREIAELGKETPP
ncbi:MAG TPA: hypothetical protein VMZ74_03375 [Ramlibacter sp.]|nr:hypothetical protein [Ramlibacter sp.]